jgi:hypothetical protein
MHRSVTRGASIESASLQHNATLDNVEIMKRSLRLLAITLLAIAVSARAATFTVRTAADDGPDSFRQVILDANAEPGFSQIHFDIPPAGPHTIHPSTALPEITANVLP